MGRFHLVLIVFAFAPAGGWSIGDDGLCSPASEVHCRDNNDNAICVERDRACGFKDVHCQREPDDGSDPNRLIWPSDVQQFRFDFDEFTDDTKSQVDVGDMFFRSYCYFGSYVNGIRAIIFNRELRIWPGEPRARPSRPFGLAKFDVSCADFNNSDYDGLGFNVIIQDRQNDKDAMPLLNMLDDVYRFDELNIDKAANEKLEYYTESEMSKCTVGGSDSLAIKKFDVNKGWKKMYGARFFSEGIVDIKGTCPSKPADLDDDQEVKSAFGNFTDDKENMKIFRSDDFWTWSKPKKCPEGHLVCMLEGRFNELVGIYKLSFSCCPMNRTGMKGAKAPQKWDQSKLNAPPKVGEPCMCSDGSNGTMVTPITKPQTTPVTNSMSAVTFGTEVPPDYFTAPNDDSDSKT